MKLEMNRAWNQAVALIGGNKDLLFVVAGVFFFLPYLALLLAVPELAGASAVGGEAADAEAAFEELGRIYASIWWMIAIMALVQAAGMLGLMALLTDRRRPTLGEALKIGARKALPYIAAYLLLGMTVGLVALILIAAGAAAGPGVALLLWLVGMVGFVYVAVKFSLVPAVLVKEDLRNPLTALARSWRITKGNSLRLFVFYFLLLVVMVILMMVLSLVVGLVLGIIGGGALLFGSALLSAAVNAIWVTLFLAVVAAVHDQLAGAGAGAAPTASDETLE